MVFFIASPEYNSSISALLKNTLDWISRAEDDNEAPLIAFKGKVAAIAAASPGALGGLRGLVTLRMILGNIGVHVLPQQAAINSVFEAFGDNNRLLKESQQAMLKAVVDQLVTTASRFK